MSRSADYRRLYTTKAWAVTRDEVMSRDGYQCVMIDWPAGERCGARMNLSVHHAQPLRRLWAKYAENWEGFLEAATQAERLVTVCPLHHRRLDRDHQARDKKRAMA